MNDARKLIAAAAVATLTMLYAGLAPAGTEEGKAAKPAQGMATKDQVVEKALADHPGKVEKTYREKQKGKDVWEVKIQGDDGKEWELYYDAKTAQLVRSKSQ